MAIRASTTAEGFYDKNVGQFILPYDAVRQARDPDALLLGFSAGDLCGRGRSGEMGPQGAGAAAISKVTAGRELQVAHHLKFGSCD